MTFVHGLCRLQGPAQNEIPRSVKNGWKKTLIRSIYVAIWKSLHRCFGTTSVYIAWYKVVTSYLLYYTSKIA